MADGATVAGFIASGLTERSGTTDCDSRSVQSQPKCKVFVRFPGLATGSVDCESSLKTYAT